MVVSSWNLVHGPMMLGSTIAIYAGALHWQIYPLRASHQISAQDELEIPGSVAMRGFHKRKKAAPISGSVPCCRNILALAALSMNVGGVLAAVISGPASKPLPPVCPPL